MSTPPRILCGVVISAGKMMRAVKVRTAKQVYNSFLKKVGFAFTTVVKFLSADTFSAFLDLPKSSRLRSQ